jgi:hypothetical protein
LSKDCDFSDFFKPTNALNHFPETPMVPVTLAHYLPNCQKGGEINLTQIIRKSKKTRNK